MCHFCNERRSPIDVNVRGHRHSSGRYRGVGHASCNINGRDKCLIFSVVFHNVKSSWSPHAISAVSETNKHKIACIPQNTQKFLSVGVGRVKFIDSLNLLPSSLEKLIQSNKRKGASLIDNWQSNFKYRKWIYPYDFMDSFARLSEQRYNQRNNLILN